MYTQLSMIDITPSNLPQYVKARIGDQKFNDDPEQLSFLPDYPGLAAFLDKYRKADTADLDENKSASTESGCPRYVSLGVNGHYYLRTNRRHAWDLPEELMSQPWYSENKVKAVWLGMKDAWVAQLKNGERRYNLQGQYSGNSGKLEENIERGFGRKRPGQRIKAMALNLTNPDSFACVWGNGGIIYNDASEFDGFIFEEFATKNFGTKFD
ncbi:uncharacterized protein N7477_004126 [Penicillium maclennaniae]|uniref:uncharacterized protein n=1 Tax=Penicillium maclennaniae TaxID=1343394 RepID=UPI00253FD87A|nr:uncharacterized protein N7477_004126 [Penicillium maclennaniae]KAJ5678493.1 hypothetical protein N7477_004126 [Penicillium maclennaniae]